RRSFSKHPGGQYPMAYLRKRNGFYSIRYSIGNRERQKALGTTCLQVAKEKLRQFESARAQGDTNPLPGRTPIAVVVGDYVRHIRQVKTAKSAQTDVYYLRDVFGAVCPELEVNSRRRSDKARKRPPKPGQDRRRRAPTIEADCFERITTAQIAELIGGQVASRGLAPKTANRYREILTRLFNWAMEQRGVR